MAQYESEGKRKREALRVERAQAAASRYIARKKARKGRAEHVHTYTEGRTIEGKPCVRCACGKVLLIGSLDEY